jgi:hypothetical protein
MTSDDHLYLDIRELYERGWTETLVRKYLGKPDRWKSVDHFRNYTGKRTYFLGRIEEVENSDEFLRAYRASLSRRKVDPEMEATFQTAREATIGAVRKWQESLTPRDHLIRECLARAAAELESARQRGFRTPHK